MNPDVDPAAVSAAEVIPISRWRQINLTFANWRSAEQYAATHLFARLTTAERDGVIRGFWFVRKSETWRLRLLPTGRITEFYTLLAGITDDDRVRDVAEPLYAAERYALGGDQATDLAHLLFQADSRHVLGHLAAACGDHRRELGVLLATRLMRAAGLEFYEQGDVWHNVSAHRRQPSSPTPSPHLITSVQRLITATADTPTSPLSANPAWPAAHEYTGRNLRRLDHSGALTRDLRGLLTHHVLFQFNRLGIPAADAGLLAAAAVQATFHHTPGTRTGKQSIRITDSGAATVQTSQPGHDSASAAELRDRLVALLKEQGHIRSAGVQNAFTTVHREIFLPGVDLETVYTRRQIVTKRDADGAALSSASSPSLVADMLEQLDPQPGDNILEIGAATGINAALLATMTGPTGTVVTIELDQDLADGARTNLARAGYDTVEVICGDGALGNPDKAPYDRIIVTAGAWDISTALWDQLADNGRIVVPLRLHESGLTRCFAFQRTGPDRLVSTTSPLVCGFVPLRGATEHAEQHVRLGTDVALKIDAADNPNHLALRTVLDHPRHEVWTGIHVGDADPIGHLDLWLLVNTNRPFGRLKVGEKARTSGSVTPAYRWAGAAIYHDGTIAYLAFRPVDDNTQELGVVAHGPDAEKLAAELGDLLDQWNVAGRPDQPTVTAYRAGSRDSAPGDISRPDTILSISF